MQTAQQFAAPFALRYTLGASCRPIMKVRDLIQWIEQDGWRLARTRGSHRQFKHAEKMGTVTIAGHPSDEVHPKTLQSALKQAGLR